MEFKLKRLCMAIGLPLLGILSLYWLKQRKKIGGSGCSDSAANLEKIPEQTGQKSDGPVTSTDNQANVKVDQLNQNESTVESQSIQCCAASAVCCKANRESIDQDNAISTDNRTADQPAKPASTSNSPVKLNNNDNDFKSIDPANDLQTASQPLHSTISSPDKHDSADQPKKPADSSTNQPITDVQPTILDKSANEKDELHASSKSLAEGEEMFETDNKTSNQINSESNEARHRRHSSDNSTANASTVNESAKGDTTTMTFDTARDFSINDSSIRADDLLAGDSDDSSINYVSSANATANSSIRSLKDSTIGSFNCSTKTLRSLNDSKQDADQLGKPKIELPCEASVSTSNAVESSVQKDEKVKEDYLNATAVNASNSSMANAEAIESVNFKSNEKPNNSTSEVDDEEKHLNVTEAEFKNDTVKQVVEKRDDASQAIKPNEKSVEGAAKTVESVAEEATKSLVCFDKAKCEVLKVIKLICSPFPKQDDSIIFEGIVAGTEKPTCKAKPAQNGVAQLENIAKESAAKESAAKANATPKPAVNLNDSDDVEIVFESCDDIKPKQLPNLNGRPARPKEEKSSSVAGTPRKANQQVPNNHAINEFTFEIPRDLCGLLIGAKGSFINPVMHQTNTKISLLNHPTILNMNLCSIKGHYNGITEALAIIRERFPLSRFPQVTLLQTPNMIPVETISEAAQLHLPEGISCDVIVSDSVSPKHVFLQQPTHASFHLLQRLDQYMISTYNFNDTPGVDEPAVGIICAVQRGEGWYRAIVTDCSGPNAVVRLLDYGGYITVPKASLRQVQRDYMSIPFQATECFLAHVEPVNDVWTEEAHKYFKSLTDKQILQAYIVGYTEERIPNIQLYRIVNKQAFLINQELCDAGHAIYVN